MSKLGKFAKIKAKQKQAGQDLTAGPKKNSTQFIKSPHSDDSSGKQMFEQLQGAMETDYARIKLHKKIDEKIAVKKELLPAYLGFVLEYIRQGFDYPCDVAVRVMIWLFDIDDIENGLKVGLYLVGTGKQRMPANFGRDIETFLCDAVYDWSKVQLDQKQSALPYLEDLVNAVEAGHWDLHPAVHSKIFVMLAKHHFELGLFGYCVLNCEKAEQVNPEGAGVKTLRAKALAQIEKQNAQKPTSDETV